MAIPRVPFSSRWIIVTNHRMYYCQTLTCGFIDSQVPIAIPRAPFSRSCRVQLATLQLKIHHGGSRCKPHWGRGVGEDLGQVVT